jgi:hypothetical protein
MAQRKPGKSDLNKQWIASDRAGSDDPHQLAGYETEVTKPCRDPVGGRLIVDVTDQRLGAQRKLREPLGACVRGWRHLPDVM